MCICAYVYITNPTTTDTTTDTTGGPKAAGANKRAVLLVLKAIVRKHIAEEMEEKGKVEEKGKEEGGKDEEKEGRGNEEEGKEEEEEEKDKEETEEGGAETDMSVDAGKGAEVGGDKGKNNHVTFDEASLLAGKRISG